MAGEGTMSKPADQPTRLDETLDAKPYEPPKPARSLTGFYVALGAVVALALFGAWFWRAYTVWWFDTDEAKRRQAAAAAKLGVPVEKSVDLPPSPSGSGAASGDGIKLDLVLVPAGRFKMGSPAEEKDRVKDEVQHWVVITRPFYLGKYEVTQEQWEKVMGRNPSSFKGAKNPVECVNWDNCQKFINKLNNLGKGPGQFRLPTEAEWEWACRAGTRTRFCCGDNEADLGDYAWFTANSKRSTDQVGARKPNAWGLYDMHGNVWEWCWDCYGEDYYAKSPRSDPQGPATYWDRVLRGGSGDDIPVACRSAFRTHSDPEHGNVVFVGFRVAMAPAGN